MCVCAGCGINLANIENELNRMRAETLGDAGKKLEMLNAMLKQAAHHRRRMLGIRRRVDQIIAGKPGRRKKRILTCLRERLDEKIARKESEIGQMKAHKEVLFRNLVLQREALGVTDHRIIHQFYGDQD